MLHGIIHSHYILLCSTPRPLHTTPHGIRHDVDYNTNPHPTISTGTNTTASATVVVTVTTIHEYVIIGVAALLSLLLAVVVDASCPVDVAVMVGRGVGPGVGDIDGESVVGIPDGVADGIMDAVLVGTNVGDDNDCVGAVLFCGNDKNNNDKSFSRCFCSCNSFGLICTHPPHDCLAKEDAVMQSYSLLLLVVDNCCCCVDSDCRAHASNVSHRAALANGTFCVTIRSGLARR